MEDNLAAEIARIEAELEADRQFHEQKQQQPFAPQVSAFGVPGAQPQQQQQQLFQQQQQQQPPQQQHAFMPQPHGHAVAHPQQQQQQPGAAAASQAHQFSKDTDGRSVFVGNLPKGDNGGPTTTPEELAQFFADCGQILNCTVLRDRTTGEPKGTAYIEFASYTGMGKAIDTKNNSNFKGSSIIVTKKRSSFRPERARGGRGRAAGTAAAAPYQAMLGAMMEMMGSAMMHRGGRGGRGRGRGAPGGFQPFQ